MTMPQTTVDDAPTLRISRTFRAGRERVFRAFSDPTRLQQWWGPEGLTVPVCELDPRPGGAWTTTMRDGDGKHYTVGGVYREVDPPRRLVFTWAWTQPDGSRGHETLVTLAFEERGDATHLTLTQETFQDADARDKHREGWESSLDCLEQALATGEP